MAKQPDKSVRLECSCIDWRENNPIFVNMFMYMMIHGQGGYKGKLYNYCPWCGKELEKIEVNK